MSYDKQLHIFYFFLHKLKSDQMQEVVLDNATSRLEEIII